MLGKGSQGVGDRGSRPDEGIKQITPRIPVNILRLLDELSELSQKSLTGFLGPTGKEFKAWVQLLPQGECAMVKFSDGSFQLRCPFQYDLKIRLQMKLVMSPGHYQEMWISPLSFKRPDRNTHCDMHILWSPGTLAAVCEHSPRKSSIQITAQLPMSSS